MMVSWEILILSKCNSSYCHLSTTFFKANSILNSLNAVSCYCLMISYILRKFKSNIFARVNSGESIYMFSLRLSITVYQWRGLIASSYKSSTNYICFSMYSISSFSCLNTSHFLIFGFKSKREVLSSDKEELIYSGWI